MTVVTYTSASGVTSWTAPDYVESVVVECWGAGGYGASRTSDGAGGGGGGGAYAKKTLSVTPGQVYTVNIGVSSASPDTWFSTSGTVLAKGGSDGVTNSTAGALGGSAAASIGDIVYAGGSGGTAVASGGGGGAGAETTGAGQNGSSPAPGTGTYPGGSGAITQGNGTSAVSSQPGGGGGALRTGSGVRIGGAGGNGIIRLTYTAGVAMPQVQSRYTKRVNGAAVGGDNYTGTTTIGGGSSAGSTKNNGGTVLRGGTISSALWSNQNIGLRYALTGPIVYNTSALSGNRKINDKALSAGNFATMTAGRYIIRRITTTLAGQSNTILQSPAASFGIRKSIHKSYAWRTKFMYKILYQKVTSSISELTDGTARPEQSYTYYYSLNNEIGEQNSTATNPDSLGANVDAAATPSLAVPGQLIYKGPAILPVLDLYKARTQG